MLCRNAWMPPGRGGKSLVTIRVLCIALDSTEPARTVRTAPPAALHGSRTAGQEIMPSHARRTDRGSGGRHGHEALPGRTPGDLGADQAGAAAVRLQGVRLPRPGR